MPKNLYSRVLAVGLFLSATSQVTMPGMGSIEGVVMDRTGAVANALVEAHNEIARTVTTARSDLNGHYQIIGLPSGRYSLLVKTPSQNWVWIPKVLVEPGKTTHQDIYIDPLVSLLQEMPRGPKQ